MPVDPAITTAILQQELLQVRELGRVHHWGVIPDFARQIVTVTMYSHTGDLFIIEAVCDNYKEVPPFFEFVDPVTGERGTKAAYPKGHDSFFHQAPCLCAPFNRKAYKAIHPDGPHADWSIGDWTRSTASGTAWENYTSLADMFGLIQTRLSRPDLYKGRQP
jgi:hypothetical protein